MVLYKIIGFAVVGIMAATIMKKAKNEYALVISLFVGLALTFYSVSIIEPVVQYLKEIGSGSSASEYINIMFKSCAIAVISSIASDLCADAGEKTIGVRIEMCGKCIILAYSLPLLKAVFENIGKMLS